MQTNRTLGNSRATRLSRVIGIPRLHDLGKRDSVAAWLPVALGTIFGILAAVLILQQSWTILMVAVLIVPAILLFFYYPFIAVFIWLLVFPFFVKEALPGARMIHWILHRVMIPGGVLMLVFMSATGIRKLKGFRIGLVDWIMAAYLVYSLTNIVLLTDQPITQMVRYYDRIFVPFCMYWLIRLIQPGQTDLYRLAPVAIVIILSQGAIGMLSWFAPQFLPDRWLGRSGERTVGTFGNPGVFTTTLLLAAVIVVQTLWRTSPRKKSNVSVSLLAVGAAFFFVFFSFSRGSWLGAIPLWIGLYILFPKPMIRLTLIGSIALVPLLAFGPLDRYTTFAEERLFAESSAEGRVIGGAATLRMISEKPVFGWGYSNHELYDEQFRDRVLGLVDSNEQSSHNTYLLIAAEMGMPGLILYFLPTAWLFYLTVKYWRRLPETHSWARSLLVMLWLLILDHALVALFTDMIQSNYFNTTIWWMALGLIANIHDSTSAGTTRRSGAMTELYMEEERSAQWAATSAPEARPQTEHIFIVGVSRSGTTLMRNILNQSDQIAISRENHFLGHLLGSEGMRHKFRKFGDLHQDANVRRLVDFLYSGGSEKSSWLRRSSAHWRWITRRIDKEVFLQKILESDRSERAMFAAMMELFAERKGKAIKGEKTPAHFQYAETLLDWFPNAKIIHMMRDPRGIFVSELRRRQKEAQSFPYRQLKRVPGLMKLYILLQTTLTWGASARSASANLAKYPERYTVQRFEDLVRQPREQVPALCAYLGVPFQEQMLEQEVVSMGFQEKQSGFDAGAADRWKKYIGLVARRWFHFWFHRQLRRYGYDD